MFHVTFLFAYWAGIRSQDVTRVAFNAKRKLADIKLSTCNRITQVGWRTASSWAGERRFLRLVAAWCERSLFRFESRDFLSVFVQLIQKLSYVRSGFKSLWSLKVNPFYLFHFIYSSVFAQWTTFTARAASASLTHQDLFRRSSSGAFVWCHAYLLMQMSELLWEALEGFYCAARSCRCITKTVSSTT